MNVTDCLERAREAAALADRLKGAERLKVLEISETWLKLADAEAKEALKSDGNSSGG